MKINVMMKDAPQGVHEVAITGIEMIKSSVPTEEDKVVLRGLVTDKPDLGEVIIFECPVSRAHRKLSRLVYYTGTNDTDEMNTLAAKEPIKVKVSVGEWTNDEGKTCPTVTLL